MPAKRSADLFQLQSWHSIAIGLLVGFLAALHFYPPLTFFVLLALVVIVFAIIVSALPSRRWRVGLQATVVVGASLAATVIFWREFHLLAGYSAPAIRVLQQTYGVGPLGNNMFGGYVNVSYLIKDAPALVHRFDRGQWIPYDTDLDHEIGIVRKWRDEFAGESKKSDFRHAARIEKDEAEYFTLALFVAPEKQLRIMRTKQMYLFMTHVIAEGRYGGDVREICGVVRLDNVNIFSCPATDVSLP